MDAHARGFLLTQQIEANVTQDGKIFIRVTKPNARFIFPKGHI